MKLSVYLTLLILITGCQTVPQRSSDNSRNEDSPTADKQIDTPQNLSSDLIFEMLVGEIAAQRGDRQTAYSRYLEAARLTNDPHLAERATQLALNSGRPDAIRAASEFWMTIAPERTTPHKILALLDIQAKDISGAQKHLSETIRIEQSEGRDGYIQAANALEKANNPTLALELMQQLTQSAGNNHNALFAVALTASRANRYDLAGESLNSALALKPGWPQALILLSRNAMALGNQAEAQKILRNAVEESPDDTALRSVYAQLLMETQLFNASYQQFQILNEQQPNNPDIIFTLGILAGQLEKPAQAKSHFQQLLTLKKRENDGLYHLGQIEENSGNNTLAIEWYRKVKGNRRIEAMVRIAILYAREGRIEEAREVLQNLRGTEPSYTARLYLIEGGLLRDAGNLSQAMSVFNEAIDQFPDNIPLLYARAMLNAPLGQIDSLEQDLKKVLGLDPNHVDALNALGYSLADQTTRYQEALKYIQRAITIKPDHPAILDSMGWVLFRLGKNEEALSYLRRAMELQPDPEIAAHLGEVLWTIGDTTQARQVWDRALASDPDSDYLNRVLRRYP